MKIIFDSQIESKEMEKLQTLSHSFDYAFPICTMNLKESLSKVADFIAKHIILHHQAEMIDYTLYTRWFFTDEMNQIIKAKFLEQKPLKSQTAQVVLRKEIAPLLSEGHINIRGLLTFRLEAYKELLYNSLIPIVEEVKEDERMIELISMVRGYYLTQPKKSDALHIVHQEDGSYLFFDESHEPLDLDYELYEPIQDELDKQDMVIGNIMMHLPETVYLYTQNYDDMLNQMIQNIFKEHVYLHNKYPFKIAKKS